MVVEGLGSLERGVFLFFACAIEGTYLMAKSSRILRYLGAYFIGPRRCVGEGWGVGVFRYFWIWVGGCCMGA